MCGQRMFFSMIETIRSTITLGEYFDDSTRSKKSYPSSASSGMTTRHSITLICGPYFESSALARIRYPSCRVQSAAKLRSGSDAQKGATRLARLSRKRHL